ncbi:unnamed protein product [Didymodactylos carnosus]|uniref:C2H2-type domain-containing protein n=1 Tax=Didymodactylos carnosus TaxID=1234261 RepID=A0A814KV94_9BILA|nr:unnamed protein product [Didymodactylos carnosus]CAF3825361.1 unnamed protein product [Didymodactylos carnosus]
MFVGSRRPSKTDSNIEKYVQQLVSTIYAKTNEIEQTKSINVIEHKLSSRTMSKRLRTQTLRPKINIQPTHRRKTIIPISNNGIRAKKSPQSNSPNPLLDNIVNQIVSNIITITNKKELEKQPSTISTVPSLPSPSNESSKIFSYMCPICYKAFEQSYYLRTHFFNFHQIQKPFVCQYDCCLSSNDLNNDYLQHLCKNHSDNPLLLSTLLSYRLKQLINGFLRKSDNSYNRIMKTIEDKQTRSELETMLTKNFNGISSDSYSYRTNVSNLDNLCLTIDARIVYRKYFAKIPLPLTADQLKPHIGLNYYQCKLCSSIFRLYSACQEHIKNIHTFSKCRTCLHCHELIKTTNNNNEKYRQHLITCPTLTPASDINQNIGEMKMDEVITSNLNSMTSSDIESDKCLYKSRAEQSALLPVNKTFYFDLQKHQEEEMNINNKKRCSNKSIPSPSKKRKQLSDLTILKVVEDVDNPPSFLQRISLDQICSRLVKGIDIKNEQCMNASDLLEQLVVQNKPLTRLYYYTCIDCVTTFPDILTALNHLLLFHLPKCCVCAKCLAKFGHSQIKSGLIIDHLILCETNNQINISFMKLINKKLSEQQQDNQQQHSSTALLMRQNKKNKQLLTRTTLDNQSMNNAWSSNSSTAVVSNEDVQLPPVKSVIIPFNDVTKKQQYEKQLLCDIDTDVICSLCLLKFSTDIDLKTHITKSHLIHNCILCSKIDKEDEQFIGSTSYHDHLISSHSSKSTPFYRCYLCSVKFELMSQLCLHLQKVCLSQCQRCDLCQQSEHVNFSTPIDLFQHIIQEHQNIIQLYQQCPVCLADVDKANLKQHFEHETCQHKIKTEPIEYSSGSLVMLIKVYCTLCKQILTLSSLDDIQRHLCSNEQLFTNTGSMTELIIDSVCSVANETFMDSDISEDMNVLLPQTFSLSLIPSAGCSKDLTFVENEQAINSQINKETATTVNNTTDFDEVILIESSTVEEKNACIPLKTVVSKRKAKSNPSSCSNVSVISRHGRIRKPTSKQQSLSLLLRHNSVKKCLKKNNIDEKQLLPSPPPTTEPKLITEKLLEKRDSITTIITNERAILACETLITPTTPITATSLQTSPTSTITPSTTVSKTQLYVDDENQKRLFDEKSSLLSMLPACNNININNNIFNNVSCTQSTSPVINPVLLKLMTSSHSQQFSPPVTTTPAIPTLDNTALMNLLQSSTNDILSKTIAASLLLNMNTNTADIPAQPQQQQSATNNGLVLQLPPSFFQNVQTNGLELKLLLPMNNDNS